MQRKAVVVKKDGTLVMIVAWEHYATQDNEIQSMSKIHYLQCNTH